ncbi:putative gustatory receptor 59b [Drosophila biarmipes]|uniref:putative gustatory receptor 59b n=1 Tax=Drosophila biarmipes TaxID=125945 RepID=UPI0021CCD2E1|nr:putative gustatory receptor 59b [Drosophila biarmipes]
MTRSGRRTSSKLRNVLILKTCLSATILLGYNVSGAFFGLWMCSDTLKLFESILIVTGFNIMVNSVYLHFISFWNIARGYEIVNQRMDELIPVTKPYTSLEKEEIYQLWALHSHLGRVFQRLQTTCGIQMLVLRFDFFLRIIIHGFHCFIFIFYDKESTPKGIKTFIITLCCMRMVGCFLNDYVIELATEYQRRPKDLIIEGILTKELSAYIIYERSMPLNLKIGGLYTANRSNFLRLSEGVLCFFILLLQFLLLYTN